MLCLLKKTFLHICMGPGFLLLRLAEKTWMQPYVPGPEELHGVMAACMTEPQPKRCSYPHQQLVGWTWLAWQEVCTQTKELSPRAHCCQRGQENFLIR